MDPSFDNNNILQIASDDFDVKGERGKQRACVKKLSFIRVLLAVPKKVNIRVNW